MLYFVHFIILEVMIEYAAEYCVGGFGGGGNRAMPPSVLKVILGDAVWRL